MLAHRLNKREKVTFIDPQRMSRLLTCDAQAAASASAANVLRSHAVPPSMLERISADLPDSDPQQTVANSVHAMCQWRDDTARQEDEGTHSLTPS